MIYGNEINKNQPQPGKIPCEGEAYKSSNSLDSGIGWRYAAICWMYGSKSGFTEKPLQHI
jgi:hypothetical protein